MTNLITIPASDIKPGDVLHIQWTVDGVKSMDAYRISIINTAGSQRLLIDPAELLTVTRPDPDADLNGGGHLLRLLRG